MRKIILFFSLITALFCGSSPVIAEGTVVINEFSVSPVDKDDWIEIYSPDNVNISGWILSDKAGDFATVSPGTQLGTNHYYVISKYQRLDNDKDVIYLYDNNRNLIDSIAYGGEGNVCLPSTEGSIARIPDGSNLIDRLKNSTRGFSNGEIVTEACPSPTQPPTPTFSPTPKPTATEKPTVTIKPTSTPKPIVATNTPTEKASLNRPVTNTPQILGDEKQSPDEKQSEPLNLGIVSSSEGISPAPEELEAVENKTTPLPYLLMGSGILIILGSFYKLFTGSKSRYNLSHNANQTTDPTQPQTSS